MPPSARVFVRSTTLHHTASHSAAEDPCTRHHDCHERVRPSTHRLARRGANTVRRPCSDAGLLMFLAGNRATGACAWSIVSGMSHLPLCMVPQRCALVYSVLFLRGRMLCAGVYRVPNP